MRRIITVILACAFIFVVAPISAKTSNSTHLSALVREISNLKKELFSNKQKSATIQSQLESIEKSIGDVSKKIRKTNHAISHEESRLKSNQQKQQRYQAEIEQQQTLLEQELRALYLLGRQPYLKIILNHEDPIKISRYLHYYNSLNQARLKLIDSINQTKKSLEENSQTIESQKSKLTATYAEQQTQKEKINLERQNRHALLKQTEHKIKSQQSHLAQLMKNKEALEGLINHINEEKEFGYMSGKPFADFRHKLPWPLTTKQILQGYQAPIENGRMHTTGILIKANLGDPVHAVFGGKVVFANWLNGFGLLVIIQHGPLYMSLYARNESLYVKKDDIVKPNQIIATAGNSGGFTTPALYFEIRYNGKPENPRSWLR